MFYNNWVSPPLMNADKSEATYSLRLRTCEPMASKENDGQKENIGWTTSDIATRLNEKITSLPEDDPSREQSLVILGAHYQLEFQTTRSIDYLSRGLEICQLRHAIANSTYRGENLHSWAWTLERRFELTGSKTDLDDASIKCREALEIMPLNDPQRTPCLIILGRIEKFRFDMTGLASDLMTAIAANEAAFAMVAEDHPDRPICLNMLSIVILERGKRTGSLEDLDRAVCLCQSAWDSTRDKGYKINRLADFAMALATRSEITRKKDDLDEGIRLMETAKPTTPDSRIYLLCRLGNCYHQRFDYGEDINDLYAAITTMEGVIDAFPDGNDRSGLLSNLGSAFERLYIRFGSIEDLQRAILAHEAAVRGIANNSLQKSARLNHLSNALQVRAYFTTSIQDLDKAISAAEEAVGLIQDVFGHVDPVNTLSLAHYHRFQFTHSTSDLDRAIDSLNSIIRALPMEHPAYATLNENLGIILLSRFEQTGSMEDFDISIATIRGIENSRLSRAVRLGNLGLAYNLRFQRTRQIDDWNLAVEAYSKAAETDGAPPSNRVSYARKAAALLSLYDTERAKDFLKLAVELVPSANPITLSQPSQQHIMSQFPNTASSAAALIIECGEAPYEALRLLEIGRGVAFGSQLDIRSDITDLEERNMTIASRFNDIRDQLDVFADMASVAMLGNASIVARRHTLWPEYQKILSEIRRLNGFENFLLGPLESELRKVAKKGTIVVLNESVRCDALIVTETDIYCLPLPNLKHDELERKANAFTRALRELRISTYSSTSRLVRQVLEWLWDVAVNLVLDYLGINERPDKNQEWPRVWWITTGLLNMFPIHAAGYHKQGCTKNTLDRVISSYTPTIKALQHARERAWKAANINAPKVVVTAMPTTPSLRDLPCVNLEVKEIERLLPQFVKKILDRPTKQEALRELDGCQIAHFACHGQSNFRDPSQSCLILTDGPLTVANLISLKLSQCQLAFLSACHTVDNQANNLLDEGLHLGGACQLAGFPHVIGTLWQVQDSYAATIVRNVYEGMSAGESVDFASSAEFLHHAVRSLREESRHVQGMSKQTENDPLIWAPYMHMGA